MKSSQTTPINVSPSCQGRRCLPAWISETSSSDSECSEENVIVRKKLFQDLLRHAQATGEVKTELPDDLAEAIFVKHEVESSDSEVERGEVLFGAGPGKKQPQIKGARSERSSLRARESGRLPGCA